MGRAVWTVHKLGTQQNCQYKQAITAYSYLVEYANGRQYEMVHDDATDSFTFNVLDSMKWVSESFVIARSLTIA
jgi:hypothetical protein